MLLKVLPVRVSGPRGSINTFALLDEGSTISLIDENVARTIGARGPRTSITLRGICEREVVYKQSEKVAFAIEGAFGSVDVNNAVTATRLGLPRQSLSSKVAATITKRTGVEITPYRDASLALLLEQDNWELIVTREFMNENVTGYGISRTKLG